ncbi:hypothetical protein C3B51_12440 [Pseudoalteromonas rubra]|uniref:Uncharacterized protein n=1 Tax=Pseudoalteromonas rubra TaxID=43658 RepID=A0A4Q7EAQ3_9GAMM|nr:hypothetical protein [Pseudoalteromonas rubra]RZM80361.1 hypothetical protein C3B51_12440 [Pseudoalteromonas rubra]
MNALNFLIVAVAATAFTGILFADANAYVLAMLALTAAVMYIKRKNINVLHIGGIVLITALLEYVIILLVPLRGDIPTVYWGTFIFGAQILICYITIRVLVLRTYLSRKYLIKYNSDKVGDVNLTHAEGILAGTYRIITIVMWLALAEYILRNLDQLGINNEISNLFQNWRFVYDNYEFAIYPLRAFVSGVVLSMLFVTKLDTERLEKKQPA